MMGFRTITSRYAGNCRRCRQDFPAGTRVRWAKGAGSYHLADNCEGATAKKYSRAKGSRPSSGCTVCGGLGTLHGGRNCPTCDGTGAASVQKYAGERSRSAYDQGDRSPGAIASHYDRRGAYSADGTFLGTTGPRCEDAPCCGCCS